MNSTGHHKIAELVNSVLTKKFPEEYLLMGSIDPDEGKYQSYRGIESKHHYHPHTESELSGRLHGQAEILEIVYRRVHIARQHWLSNNKENAAFEFGIATHYYMDGFICSPSIDESKHARGDRVFANTASDARISGSSG